MKIITWNCRMKYRIKANEILTLQPDIVVVPECENKERQKFGKSTKKPNDSLWFGKNVNKGIGIFSYSNFKFRIHDSYVQDYRYFIPIEVYSKKHTFNLLIVWNNPGNRDYNYIRQATNALKHYVPKLGNRKLIIIGDFNSNNFWDKPQGKFKHNDLVTYLEKDFEIKSLYHKYYKEKQGNESLPTIYWKKNENNPYHVDYCFASSEFSGNVESVEIGDYNRWSKFSDHMPMIVNIKEY